MIAVTGVRPRVPTKSALGRIRYTPITAGFAPIAELSRQIANRRGLAADIDATGETKGVLLDVAELWEMYVLSVFRKAAAPLTVTHGTRERSATKKLLRSDISDQGLGTLIPDAILHSDSAIKGVIDAKYKSLHPSASSPNGPQRDDLYQMAAYLGRFQPPAGMLTWGILAYPFDPSIPDTPFSEQNSPWSLDERKQVVFATLPHNPAEAVAKLRSLVAQYANKPNASSEFQRAQLQR